MKENDAMQLLVEANPVRVEDLAPFSAPSRFTRLPGRRLSLVLVLAVVGAVALAGAFAYAGRGSGRPGSQGLRQGPGPGGFGKFGGRVGPTGPTGPISLADAAAALGAPLVLPDIPPIDPAHAARISERCQGSPGKPCEVNLRFPAQGVFLSYDPHWYESGLSVAEYEPTAERLGGQVVSLSGTPAYVGRDGDGIQFQLRGIFVFIWTGEAVHDGRPSVQAIAQSIVDRAK